MSKQQQNKQRLNASESLEEWWKAYASGDKNVFGKLYDFYHKKLTFYCIGLLKDMDLAENAASDTLVKLMTYSNPEKIESYESWLFTVAKNSCLTLLKRMNTKREVEKNILYSSPKEKYSDAEDQLTEENIDQLIQSTLSEREYLIWDLHQKGYKNEEIAKIMNMHPKTVANSKTEIRSKLKKALYAIT